MSVDLAVDHAVDAQRPLVAGRRAGTHEGGVDPVEVRVRRPPRRHARDADCGARGDQRRRSTGSRSSCRLASTARREPPRNRCCPAPTAAPASARRRLGAGSPCEWGRSPAPSTGGPGRRAYVGVPRRRALEEADEVALRRVPDQCAHHERHQVRADEPRLAATAAAPRPVTARTTALPAPRLRRTARPASAPRSSTATVTPVTSSGLSLRPTMPISVSATEPG